MNRSIARLLGGIVILGAILAGCTAGPAPDAGQPTPAATALATPAPATATAARPTATAGTAGQPTAAPATPATPAFAFAPQNGGAGTRVALNGWNFAPGQPVAIRLGMPQPTGEVLASAFADAGGSWSATLVMPDRLPSGELITRRDLMLVAMSDANVALASAPFAFEPASIPPREEAPQLVRSLLSAYASGGDIAAFLSADLRARLARGEPATRLLSLPPGALRSFDVSAPLDRPADALFIPAQLTYDASQERREFTVVLEAGSWRVAGSSLPLDAPTPDPADQAIHTALTADLNGDGVDETITYRTGRARLSPPIDHSNPNIAAVVVAEELFVTQGAVPGGRTLLYLNPIALNSESQRLLLMGQENAPNPGFVVVIYGGANHSYYITPLGGDGMPSGQAVRAVWDAQQGAYVLG